MALLSTGRGPTVELMVGARVFTPLTVSVMTMIIVPLTALLDDVGARGAAVLLETEEESVKLSLVEMDTDDVRL